MMTDEKKPLKDQRVYIDEHSKKFFSKELGGHPHSHDLGLKRTLLKIYILKIICRMIFAKADKQLEQIIDWNTITIAKADTVLKKETRSDFALNVNFKDSRYKAQILLFLEHFSHPDPKAMPRLLVQHTHFYAQKEFPERLVFSVVISQGVSGEQWDLPLTFQKDLEAKDILPKEYKEIISPYLVNFQTFFLDLQKTVIANLNPILRPIFYVFKHIQKAHSSQPKEVRHEFFKEVYRLIADVAEEMKTSVEVQEIFEDLRQASKEFANLSRDDIIKHVIMDELEDIALYLIQYNPGITEDVLYKASKEVHLEKGGKNYMEELEFTREGAKLKGIEIGLQKGRLEGRQEGRQKGRQEGRQEGLNSVILNMLKRKMDLSTIMECTGVSKEQVLELQKQTHF